MDSTRPETPLILLVEDYSDAREMYAAFLKVSGFRVVEARNGVEAVDKGTRLRPDIILMDLALPGLDGWEATRRLKEDQRTHDIPVIALTGHALAGHAARAQRAGCDSFMAKPCLPEALLVEIKRVLSLKASASRRADPPRP
jgi:CheY-like chemotaxis protein